MRAIKFEIVARAQLELNKLANRQILACALGSQKGVVDFRIDRDHMGVHNGGVASRVIDFIEDKNYQWTWISTYTTYPRHLAARPQD